MLGFIYRFQRGRYRTAPMKGKKMANLRNSIDIRPMNPVIGAEIFGIDLCGDLSDDDIDVIRDALNVHQVLFFRDQPLTNEQHLAFGRRFGELHVHPNTRGLRRKAALCQHFALVCGPGIRRRYDVFQHVQGL